MKRALALLLTPMLFAQAPQRLQFEVASVRPALPNQGKGAQTPAAAQTYPGQLRLSYLTLKDIIQRAYGLEPHQVIAPDWMSVERYDIMATLPEGATTAQVPQMLQSLLIDRFSLKSHSSQKEFSVFLLERGDRPFTLTEVQPTDEPEGIQVLPIQTGGMALKLGRGASFTLTEGKFDGKGMSMDMLASMSSLFLPLPAVNRTGLKGFYNFNLPLVQEDFSLMFSFAAARRLARLDVMEQLSLRTPTSYFDALAKVGLKMAKGKALLDVMNIDDANKLPSEN
jgi:uncharacterized protein (TIGR03435 family)